MTDYTKDLTESLSLSDGIVCENSLFPYAWWHLNESSGTNVADSSGDSRNGTTINMEDADWVAGKLNNCLRFDGNNEYVNCGSIASFEKTDPFSIEFWVKFTSTADRYMVSKQTTAPKGWGVRGYTGNIWLTIYATSTDRFYANTTGSYNDGAWHHVVATYDGSNNKAGMEIYVDGSSDTLVAGVTSISGSILNSANCQISGRGGLNALFVGDVDEVVIYDKRLTADWISRRYNGGLGTETMALTKLLTESIPPSDSVSKTRTFTLTDIITMMDTKIIPQSVSMSDVLTMTDGVTKSLTQQYIESLNLNSSLDILRDAVRLIESISMNSTISLVKSDIIAHNNIEYQAQRNIWLRLRASADLVALTKNILDGQPAAAGKGMGYPYVVVPTPVMEEEMITFSHKLTTLTFGIEIHSTKQSNVRRIVDVIREVLKADRIYLSKRNMAKYLTSSTSPSVTVLPDNTKEYVLTLSAKFEAFIKAW